MRSIKLTFSSLLILSFLLFTPIEAEAKGFGKETTESTSEVGAGQCMTTTVTKVKFLWITVQKTVEYNMHSC
jgi:hypothetical protein